MATLLIHWPRHFMPILSGAVLKRLSKTMLKIKGDRGSLCVTPRPGRNGAEFAPIKVSDGRTVTSLLGRKILRDSSTLSGTRPTLTQMVKKFAFTLSGTRFQLLALTPSGHAADAYLILQLATSLMVIGHIRSSPPSTRVTGGKPLKSLSNWTESFITLVQYSNRQPPPQVSFSFYCFSSSPDGLSPSAPMERPRYTSDSLRASLGSHQSSPALSPGRKDSGGHQYRLSACRIHPRAAVNSLIAYLIMKTSGPGRNGGGALKTEEGHKERQDVWSPNPLTRQLRCTKNPPSYELNHSSLGSSHRRAFFAGRLSPELAHRKGDNDDLPPFRKKPHPKT
ncbi:hypothetical protein JTE90_015727 [Oedothorax gibbosus]|uniref:Uncharacterized protein n=1 Tax=Oedothorax gibbosus TaxID=931172 RepID=A0AAV6TYB2_9ARAC|nr:hypothetical protein JTE90_015727 [Oedothorax gibbosus]